jgi:hypothetical protein
MDRFNIDKFVSLDELIARTREIVLSSMPCARDAVGILESRSREDGLDVSIFDYILEVESEVLDPAIESGEWKIVEAFYGMCEVLLGMGSDIVGEAIESLVVKGLVGRRSELLPWAGPLLRELVDDY